jgi:hypothetical protein
MSQKFSKASFLAQKLKVVPVVQADDGANHISN